MNDLEARILSNCEEVGDCLEWQPHIGPSRIKQMRYEGKWINAQRVLYSLRYTLIKSRELLSTCNNPKCINPEHKRQVTKSQRLAETSVKAWNKDKAARVLRMTQRERQNGKIDLDKAKMIRSDSRTHVQIASEYGVSPTLISAIKRNVRWKETTGNPFAGLFWGQK